MDGVAQVYRLYLGLESYRLVHTLLAAEDYYYQRWTLFRH